MGSVEDERRKEAAEIERLGDILKKFKVREKLNEVKEKIWKTGQIKEVTNHKDGLLGSRVALELSTSYWDIVSYSRPYETGPDFFGRQIPHTSRGHEVGKRDVSIHIGATNADSNEKIFVDSIYLSYEGFSYDDVSFQSDYYDPPRKYLFKSMPVEFGTLIIPKFIEDNLIEFTDHKLSLANLEAIGEQRILKASPFSLGGYDKYYKYIRSKKSQ